MASNNSAKGNPAHKRMSNPNMAARRARNWRDQQKRKDARRAAQAARERANKLTLASGGLTPHQALNVANRGPKVQPVTVPSFPIHLLSKGEKGKGYAVSVVGGETITVVRRSQSYETLLVFLDVLNHWAH